MDPSSFDPEDDAGAMAAAMGFSSFGAQDRPAKKRRYNANSDAVIGGSLPLPPLGSLPPKPPASVRMTGANNLPLHQRAPRGSRSGAAETNVEEIDLGEDDDEDPGGLGVGEEGGADGGVQGEDPLPQYIDTSQEAVPYEEPSGATFLHGAYGGGGHRGGRGGFQRGGARGGRGGHSGPGRPQWWLDYYDPSSNENPWEKLEQARGIESKGVWLTRPGKASADVATTA